MYLCGLVLDLAHALLRRLPQLRRLLPLPIDIPLLNTQHHHKSTLESCQLGEGWCAYGVGLLLGQGGEGPHEERPDHTHAATKHAAI